MPTEANRRFTYGARVAEDGSVLLPEDLCERIAGGTPCTLYAATGDGRLLRADLGL